MSRNNSYSFLELEVLSCLIDSQVRVKPQFPKKYRKILKTLENYSPRLLQKITKKSGSDLNKRLSCTVKYKEPFHLEL